MCKMYEVIENLCSSKGVKPGAVCKELGISRGTIGDLKTGRTKQLSAKNAKLFADYFGVSVDYILREEQQLQEPDILSQVDIGFYGDYQELTESDKQTLRDMAKLMRRRRETGDTYK